MENMPSLARFLLVSFIFLESVIAFNVDIQSPFIHRGPTGSLFGFSVAQHKERGRGWLIIGAPNAQTSQPGVTQGGAVYRCLAETQHASSCQQIPFDRTGSNTVSPRENKTHQWFGATVSSSGESGVIAACAPRYVYYPEPHRQYPAGICWVSLASFSGFQEYSPCRHEDNKAKWGVHKQGYCQAGFSASVTKDGRRLFMGAVGSRYWQGQAFSQDLLSSASLYETQELGEDNDNSYLGYSIAVGEFTGDSDWDVAVGKPKGDVANNLRGQVLICTSTMQNLTTISGEQIGEYFAYSLCVSDVNGDGLDDIVVGAPLYSDFSAKDGSYEKGRVYVIYQNEQHNFDMRDRINGTRSKGRFGMAVASLGDINRDGFGDFAVGAPYDGENGRGVVYIYHGTQHGVFPEATQVIMAENMSDPFITTFGFSLAGGLDLDENEYPDLLIGAYESDKAIYLRSRPVVTVSASLRIEPESINLDEKGCTLTDNKHVSCIVISLGLKYNGIGVSNTIDIFYQIKLDAGRSRDFRLFFLKTEGINEQNVTIRLQKDSFYGNSLYAYVKNDIIDKLTPITVQIEYNLVELAPSKTELKPILNQAVPNVLSKQVNVMKNCGKDNVCIPDLHLEVTSNLDQYIIGDSTRHELDVRIKNQGEDAFEAAMYMTMPIDINFVNIAKQSEDEWPVSCSKADPPVIGANVIKCDLGNPFPANETAKFKILLAPSTFVTAVPLFQFTITANSTNEEDPSTLEDNERILEFPVRVKVDITLSGISDPPMIFYNRSTHVAPVDKVTEYDVGPEVTHIYQVINRGPSTIQSANVHIFWPSYTLHGDHLLYLLEQPEIKGNARCQPIEDLNPLSLEIIKRRPTVLPKPLNTSYIEDTTVATGGRQKREHVMRLPKQEDTNDNNDIFSEMQCRHLQCTRILCTAYELRKHDSVAFTIRSALYAESLNQISLNEMHISSMLVIKITELPYNIDPSYIGERNFTVTTKVSADGTGLILTHIPWWIILLAVCGGLLLLALLALLLWKLGFFKRKRPPSDEFEKEPLHNETNGFRMNKGDTML